MPPRAVESIGRKEPPAAPCFLLGRNAAGVWVVRESSGRKAGLFRTQEAAIKFARDESPGSTIVRQLEGLELDDRPSSKAA